MTRARMRVVFPFFLLVLLGLSMASPKAGPRQQTDQKDTGTGQPWDAGTRYPDWQAPSTLTITNDCKRGHSFSITPENADFIDFKGVTHVSVPGKRSIELPVRFHTDGMKPGDYTGKVTITCLDCTEIPPCVQDRKLVIPHIMIALRPGTTAPPDETPQASSADDCKSVTTDCEELRRQIEVKQAAWEAAEADYTAALNHADELDWEAEYDCEYAEEGSDYLYEFTQFAKLAGIPASEYQSLIREVDQAWADCMETDAAWYAADAKARGAGAIAEAAWRAIETAEEAFAKCREDQAKACKAKPIFDDPFNGSDVWKPWPTKPTEGGSVAPTGGKPKKPDWPKVFLPPTAGVPKAATGQPTTPDHPTTQSKPPCSDAADDCEKLRLIWQQKEAEAAAAQANADAAAAVPNISEGSGWMESNGIRLTSHDLALASAASKQAFADYQAGKITADELQKIWGDSGDAAAIAKLRKAEDAAIAAAKKKVDEAAQAAAAARTVADYAKSMAAAAQAAADQAKAAANAAKQAYEDCIKKVTECERKEAGGTGGSTPGGNPPTGGGGTNPGGTTSPPTGGGGTPHTTSNDCPPFPEDCDALKARYEQLKTAAAIAQAEADRAKANQEWNNKEAAALDSEAKSAQEFADAQTSRAKEWISMAASMSAIADRDIQLRDQYPAGSPNWNSWNKAAEADKQEVQSRLKYAAELEETERTYDMQAAKLKTEAAQLRNNSSDAQARADKAKADADAAYKAWQDCLARKAQYDADCKKKAAANGTPKTTSRGGTGGTQPGGGTSAPGGTPPGGGQTGGNPPTGGGGTIARGGNPPGGTGPGGATGTPTTTEKKKKGVKCEWRPFEVDFGPYTMDTKERAELLGKIREQLQKFLEKAAPEAGKGVDAVLKGFTITSVAQNVYITYILVEIDLDTGATKVIDSKTITLDDKDAVDFWGHSDGPDARAGRAATIARNTPKGGCPQGK
jgi:hypothetical protein